MINYQRLSVDLGMHMQSFEFLIKNHSRQQDTQKLRNMYSAADKNRGLNETAGSTLNLIRGNHQGSMTPDKTAKILENNNNVNKSINMIESNETSQAEVREILLRKMKNFRDLILLH